MILRANLKVGGYHTHLGTNNHQQYQRYLKLHRAVMGPVQEYEGGHKDHGENTQTTQSHAKDWPSQKVWGRWNDSRHLTMIRLDRTLGCWLIACHKGTYQRQWHLNQEPNSYQLQDVKGIGPGRTNMLQHQAGDPKGDE